jgi:hypothetical protein
MNCVWIDVNFIREVPSIQGPANDDVNTWSQPQVKENDWTASNVTDHNNGNRQMKNDTLRNLVYIYIIIL